MLTWPVGVLATLLGLVLGSYAVTAGLRHARAESATFGRSRCDACGIPLPFAHTAPVVSFVALGGACAGCGARIDRLHLAGEIAGAVIVVGALTLGDPVAAALTALLGLVLVAAAAVDLKVKRLPDTLTTAAAVLGAALAWRRGPSALLAGAVAAVAVAAILLGLRAALRRRVGEPSLGLGDVKLLTAAALWLGVQTPWMIAAAALLGLATGRMVRPADGRIPWGPAIGAAAWAMGVSVEWGVWPTI